MNRLTHPRNSGIKTGYWSPNKKDELIEQLAAYEDTGLTPEEVEQLKESRRWIPVEERLPKRNGVYNITRYVGGNYMRDSAYFDGQDTWHNDNRVNHSRCYLTDVIAWMPLPEPCRTN